MTDPVDLDQMESQLDEGFLRPRYAAALIAEVRELRNGRELTRSLINDMVHKLNDAESQLAHSEDRIDELTAGLRRFAERACPGVVAEGLSAPDG